MSEDFRASLTINGSSLRAIFSAANSVLQDLLVGQMISILQLHGYVVEIPQTWESPRELCARLEISQATFCRKIVLSSCPKPFSVIRDGRGITNLRSHSVLDAFLKRPLSHNAKS